MVSRLEAGALQRSPGFGDIFNSSTSPRPEQKPQALKIQISYTKEEIEKYVGKDESVAGGLMDTIDDFKTSGKKGGFKALRYQTAEKLTIYQLKHGNHRILMTRTYDRQLHALVYSIRLIGTKQDIEKKMHQHRI